MLAADWHTLFVCALTLRRLPVRGCVSTRENRVHRTLRLTDRRENKNNAMTTQSTSELPSLAPVRVQPVVSRRSIVLGAMEKKLSVQLAGLNIPKDRLRVLDKLADSLTWLYLYGIITDAQRGAVGRKLIAKVQADVRKAANDQAQRPGGEGH